MQETIKGLIDFCNLIQPITLVGSQIAVIITLIGIVYQIRMLRKATCTSQYQEAIKMLFDWRTNLIQNPKLADRYMDSDYFRKVLSEHGVESYFHTVKIFHILEVFFLLRRNGIIETHMWQAWDEQVKIIMVPIKNRELWKKLKDLKIYNEHFVERVDAVVRRIDQDNAYKTVPD